jgi:hypothetical protein
MTKGIVRLMGLVVLMGFLAGCGGLSKEQQAQLDTEIAACNAKETSSVERVECSWRAATKVLPVTPYDQMLYARKLELAGMYDRGEITKEQANAAYMHYEAQVQLAMRQEAFVRQQEMNRVVMSGLNSLDQPQPQPNAATCTSTRFGNSVTTQCY